MPSGLEVISIAPMMGVDNVWCSGYSSCRRRLKGLASIIGRQSKVGWVIRKARRLAERPDPKKPTVLRGSVGVRHCESSDCTRGCDGTCVHVVNSLAGVGG
jgi:hypothetical protein